MKNQKCQSILKLLVELRNEFPASAHRALIDDLIAQFELVIEAVEGMRLSEKWVKSHEEGRP